MIILDPGITWTPGNIIFIHQILDSFSGVSELVCVKYADEVVKILEINKNVLAVFQGHYHAGHYCFRNGIHYFTIKAMSVLIYLSSGSLLLKPHEVGSNASQHSHGNSNISSTFRLSGV